jgi:hypothetical protein
MARIPEKKPVFRRLFATCQRRPRVLRGSEEAGNLPWWIGKPMTLMLQNREASLWNRRAEKVGVRVHRP